MKGYDVYSNDGCTGHTDMIVDFHLGELIRIDVKTMRWSYTLNIYKIMGFRKKRDKGVWHVWVDPNDWSIRWPKKLGHRSTNKNVIYQCPEGHENVWKP